MKLCLKGTNKKLIKNWLLYCLETYLIHYFWKFQINDCKYYWKMFILTLTKQCKEMYLDFTLIDVEAYEIAFKRYEQLKTDW